MMTRSPRRDPATVEDAGERRNLVAELRIGERLAGSGDAAIKDERRLIATPAVHVTDRRRCSRCSTRRRRTNVRPVVASGSRTLSHGLSQAMSWAASPQNSVGSIE